jgi:RimJ/RimL family protein N-acetyltransferase
VTGVRLVPLGETHLDDVAALLTDSDVLRFTRIPEPPPLDFPQKWLARSEQGRRDGTNAGFAALDADERFLGLALAPEIDREGREVELGYIVARAARGRGVATEMLRQLTEWVLAELGALRIWLVINIDNPASERVAERCGYVREGVMRSIHLRQGMRVDASLWSRLPSDPA